MKFSVEIPKETGELIIGITNFLKAIRKSQENGWQAGEDLPIIMMSALATLPDALDGWDKMDDEARANPAAMIAAGGIFGAELYKALTGTE